MENSLTEIIKRLETLRDSGTCIGTEGVEFYSMNDGARFIITSIDISNGTVEICGECYN